MGNQRYSSFYKIISIYKNFLAVLHDYLLLGDGKMKKALLVVVIGILLIGYDIYGADLFVNGRVQSKGPLTIDLHGFSGSSGSNFILLTPDPTGETNGSGSYTISAINDMLTFSSADLTNSPGDLRVRNIWYTSDRSFKENISSIESPLDKILNINGVAFNWIPEKDPDKIKEKHYGVIAQEIENVFPGLVKEGPEGEKAVAYTELIPVMIEAIKEQQKIIEKQQRDLQALRSAIDGSNGNQKQ